MTMPTTDSAAAGLPVTALNCVAMLRETAGPFPADGTNRRAGRIGDIYQSDQGRYAQSIRNLAGIPLSRWARDDPHRFVSH
ncbi:hypothetical protein HCZ23_12360 [Celeribacter sp. HF31]|nr:hypothetical protein [Celeribacter sp. HF31]